MGSVPSEAPCVCTQTSLLPICSLASPVFVTKRRNKTSPGAAARPGPAFGYPCSEIPAARFPAGHTPGLGASPLQLENSSLRVGCRSPGRCPDQAVGGCKDRGSPSSAEPVRALSRDEVRGCSCRWRGRAPLQRQAPGDRKVTAVSPALLPPPKPRCPSAGLPLTWRDGPVTAEAPGRRARGGTAPGAAGGASPAAGRRRVLPAPWERHRDRHRDRPVGAAGGWRRPPSDGAGDAATRGAEPI